MLGGTYAYSIPYKQGPSLMGWSHRGSLMCQVQDNETEGAEGVQMLGSYLVQWRW